MTLLFTFKLSQLFIGTLLALSIEASLVSASDSEGKLNPDEAPRHGGLTEEVAAGSDTPENGTKADSPRKDQAWEYLKNIVYTPEEIENWISGTSMKGIYDSKMGWVHHKGTWPDGINGAISTYNYDDTGARRMVAYADQSCRINTYGNSLTHCDQVSDGDTWQEVMATHLCEPIRNYEGIMKSEKMEIGMVAEFKII